MQSSSANYPQALIIGTEDIINSFLADTSNAVDGVDLAELMTQIIQSLLNGQYPLADFGVSFPDFSRFRNRSFMADDALVEKVTEGSADLASAMFQKINQLKGFQDGEFPYIFDRFTGRDIILQRLPY